MPTDIITVMCTQYRSSRFEFKFEFVLLKLIFAAALKLHSFSSRSMAHLSSELRGKIQLLDEEGYSQRKISARLGVCKSTVQKTLARIKKTGTHSPPKHRGVARKTSGRIDRMIRRQAVMNPRITSQAIVSSLPIDSRVSARTVRRRLSDQYGLRFHRAAKKPKLSKKNIIDRLRFCRDHQHWTVADWRKVLFSDETLIRQFNPATQGVRRPKNERYNPRFVVPTVKNSPSIMVWGAISAEGRGGLHIMPSGQSVNAQYYLKILQEKLMPWLSIRNCTIFQHDGAPCHQAKLVKNWLNQKRITILSPWPGSSPDLNPIENCWVRLKRCVAMDNPTSAEGLKQSIRNAWCQQITSEYCSNLIESMPRRIMAVLAAGGKSTRY